MTTKDTQDMSQRTLYGSISVDETEGWQITVGVGPLHVAFGSDAGSVSMIATT